jgi:phosphopantetheinyl transferase (holo-ACP synthase)
LKTGWRGKITWHDIEIVSDEAGAPSLKITGEAQNILENTGANRFICRFRIRPNTPSRR